MTTRGAEPLAGNTRDLVDPRTWHASVAVSAAVVAVSFWNVFVQGGTHTDVSWLLTVGEKMLAGEKLYVDIWETNPPFSAFLYLPMVGLGKITPFSAELWTELVTFAWVIAFGAFALALGERLGLLDRQERMLLIPVGLYLLLLFMPVTFSQREHFGVASALPMIVVAAYRMSVDGKPSPRWAWIVTAGLGAAITMMVKPHYAMAFLFPYLFVALTRRSIRLLFSPEVLVAAAVVMAYAAILSIRYSEYLSHIVPLLLDVYLVRHSLGVLIFISNRLQLVLGILLLLLMATVARPRRNPLVWSIAFAALGFYFAYLVMGKGWNYHAMPALTLTVLAISVAGARWVARATQGGRRISGGPVFLGFLLAASLTLSQTALTWGRFETPDALVARLRNILPTPVVGVLSHDIGIGHPMTRVLNGRWIERTGADWIVVWGRSTIQKDPEMEEERRMRVEARIAAEKVYKAEVWSRRTPDIVLLDPPPSGAEILIGSDSRFAKMLANYTTVYEGKRMRVALHNDHMQAWERAGTTASSPAAASD